jgi:hypothetical protein
VKTLGKIIEYDNLECRCMKHASLVKAVRESQSSYVSLCCIQQHDKNKMTSGKIRLICKYKLLPNNGKSAALSLHVVGKKFNFPSPSSTFY